MLVAQSSLVMEAMEGLGDHRAALMAEFGDYKGGVDTEQIRGVLGKLGLTSISPILCIPYQRESLDKAVGLLDSDAWFDPFVAEHLREAQTKRGRLDEGESIYEVGFPTIFYSSLADLAIVFDDVDENSGMFGDSYARGKAVANVAHETAHSAFANLTKTTFAEQDSETVVAEQRLLIGQPLVISTLRRGQASTPAYDPCWIDEAVCNYVTADVMDVVRPDHRPKDPRFMTIEYQGVYDLEIPPKYLIYSEEYPDEPGNFAAAEALGMEVLATKEPWLLPQIKALSAGRLSVKAFHDQFRNAVGNEMYRTLTERRPYGEWSNILEAITEL